MEIEKIENVRELAKAELEEYFIFIKNDYKLKKFKYQVSHLGKSFWIYVSNTSLEDMSLIQIFPHIFGHKFKYAKFYGINIYPKNVIFCFKNNDNVEEVK